MTEKNFHETVKRGIVLDFWASWLIRKVQVLDMDEVRRSLDEQERKAPHAIMAGSV